MEYNRSIGESIKKMLKRFEKWGEEKRKREYVLIRADFNAKRGKERGGIEGEEETRMEEEKKRKSKDEKINREEKRLVKFVEGIGRVIFNRNKRLRGRRVYKSFTGGRGNTLINYIIRDWEVKEKIVRMIIGEKVDSDHQPVVAWIKGKIKKRKRKGGTGEKRGI